MDYLKIRKWDTWQSYRSDRGQPPWIKVYRSLLRCPEWVDLTDAERGQLTSMWLLAADRCGVIPASSTVLMKLCFMTSKPNLKRFMDLGFIEHDATVTSECGQDDANVTPQIRLEETRLETDKTIKTIVPPNGGTEPSFLDNEIEEVFNHWRSIMGHAQAKLSQGRRKLIREWLVPSSKLKDPYTVDQLKDAVDGCAYTPHNMGQNERGTRYDDLELILRDVKHIDGFIRNKQHPPAQTNGSSNQSAATRFKEYLKNA